jgi:hypothetical protein
MVSLPERGFLAAIFIEDGRVEAIHEEQILLGNFQVPSTLYFDAMKMVLNLIYKLLINNFFLNQKPN